jgi:hypothetical protein
VFTRELLDEAIRARLNSTQAQWFSRAVVEAAHGAIEDVLRCYTGASRHLGGDRFSVETHAFRELAAASSHPLHHWSVEDAGRLSLLLARHEASSSLAPYLDAASACYEQGDASEQQSWLKAVGFLPESPRFVALAIDACRTNILPVFEAIACENPYPSQHFPDRNFNQMILKALFNGVALARVVGLDRRRNDDLARMARDYADERRAAGRTVPIDIGLATAAP